MKLVAFTVVALCAVTPCLAQEVATSEPALICGRVDGMTYSQQHRKLLLEDERRADFARYGVLWSTHRDYELDHIIPLDIGGADTPANRRPQRCDRWEGIRCVAGPAYQKDLLEALAAREVCAAYRNGDIRGAGATVDHWQAIFAAWKDWK